MKYWNRRIPSPPRIRAEKRTQVRDPQNTHTPASHDTVEEGLGEHILALDGDAAVASSHERAAEMRGDSSRVSWLVRICTLG